MYKRGGHMRGAVSQRRPASSACSTSSPSLSSSPLLTSNPQQLRTDGQHGHIGPSFDPQEHIMGGLGHMHTESPSVSIPPVPISPIPSPLVPSPSIQQSNDEENTGEEDTRFIIGPYGDSFTNATSVVRQLNKIINNYWRGEWISYSSAPKEVKNLWWNEFKRKFRWDEIEEEEIKRIFKKKAGDHIRNVINRAKTRQVKPDFITGDSWTEMNKTWENERNKQRSEQNKKNRSSTSSEGSATYAGGSITVGEHKKRMADELGMEPTYTATFERTFQKKDKTWTGDRAKAIKEKYDELLMSTASGGDGVDGSETSGRGSDNMELWVEASGGMKKGKIFGMGSLSRIYSTKIAGTSSSNAAVSRRTRIEEQMTQELSQLKHLLVQKDDEIQKVREELTEQFSQQLSQKDEQIRSLQSQTQLILRHLNLNQNQVPPVPPTNEIGDGHNAERHNDDEIAADDDYDLVSRFIN